MKGHSKIKIIHSSSNSRSMDLLDLLTSLEQQNTTPITTSPPSKFQETNDQKIKNHHPPKNATKTSNLKNQDSSFLGAQEDQENYGEMTRKLKRNSSVSSTSAIHNSLKKAFSMRRSSSVSERYCRIHDQSATLSSPPTHHHHNLDDDINGDADADSFMNKSRSMKTRYKILKACKKLIGL